MGDNCIWWLQKIILRYWNVWLHRHHSEMSTEVSGSWQLLKFWWLYLYNQAEKNREWDWVIMVIHPIIQLWRWTGRPSALSLQAGQTVMMSYALYFVHKKMFIKRPNIYLIFDEVHELFIDYSQARSRSKLPTFSTIMLL